LIDYDSKETSPTEPSLRDIRQAENIVNKIFKKDPAARVFIIAGRGHASEIISGGWKPMAYNLKQLTGIDPFTMMTQTMTERLSREQEDPNYKKAVELNLVEGISILKKNGEVKYFGSDAFDAYVFFPRTQIINGRPNWMFASGRKSVPFPFKNLELGKGLFLVQAFLEDQPYHTVPVDQIVITNTDKNKSLALKNGKYRVRIIDPNSEVVGEAEVKVK
jgi:hypothetical protein